MVGYQMQSMPTSPEIVTAQAAHGTAEEDSWPLPELNLHHKNQLYKQ